jgi:zeta-carotene desaturase
VRFIAAILFIPREGLTMPRDGDISVAVVGAGIAGLTAALRLSQRGYKVTLYEEKAVLGGNLASNLHNGVYHDVYPHMYSAFYLNFWDIVENDLGMRRETDFESRDCFKFLGLDHVYRELGNAGSPAMLWRNMFSGIAPPLDMYLWSYSMLDMLAHPFQTRGLMAQSVNGFVRSRPCATERVAALHEYIVMVIWSIHASDTSASAYRNFLLHAFGNLSPLLWLLKGNLQEKLIGPLEEKLRSLGCDIRKQTRATKVVLDGVRVKEIQLVHEDKVTYADGFDYLVLAIPPVPLGQLVVAGEEQHRIVDRLPHLSEARRLHAEPIPVLDLYLTRKLKEIPPENVAMTDSDCDLTFIDLSQLWDDPGIQGITALTVGASDYWALPSDNPHEDAHSMIRELARYIADFNPGKHWEDENSDIDWKRSHYESNQSDLIFINQVGSWDCRPDPHYPSIPNLFFAGDFCRNEIDMATVEAAVTSGLNAARALQQQESRGEPIKILHPNTYPVSTLRAMKLLMAPSAYAAKWWLTATGATARASIDKPPAWGADLVSLMSLPYAYTADWLQTAGSLWAELFLGDAAPGTAHPRNLNEGRHGPDIS